LYRIHFFKQGELILAIEPSSSDNKPRVISGDDSWFDYSFSPYSTELERSITLKEDPELWAKELAHLYNKSDNDITVRVTKVTYTDKNNLPVPPGNQPGLSGEIQSSFISNQALPPGEADVDRFNGMVLSGCGEESLLYLFIQ
jgi:hypothetical protein